MNQIPELLVLEGPAKDKRFTVTETGCRLGRSSSCEISIPDPSLSRNHCLFEVRDEALWVTDLASANGTDVNGNPLGADSRKLVAGDRILAGDTMLVVVDVGASSVRTPPVAEESKIDLGLGTSVAEEEVAQPKGNPMRLVLWGAALLALAGSVFLILSSPEEGASGGTAALAPEDKATVRSFSYEKVEADANGIYRYVISFDEASSELAVAYDDVPRENRHVRKDVKLKPETVSALNAIFDVQDLYQLAPSYTGMAQPNVLNSYSLRVIRGGKVFSTVIENETEPAVFREVRERLETFSKNELGIWAIQYSAEKLLEMSAEARRVGDAKWEERDVQYGNLSAALASYNEAVFYLETVNPKPQGYAELVNRRREAETELDRRFRDQRFLADRAINLGDWETALRELRILCEMVPNAKDPRHAEASAKLLDVEARQKKGAR